MELLSLLYLYFRDLAFLKFCNDFMRHISLEVNVVKIPVLMKLLYNLDHVSSCEQPSDSGLWVGLFGFHMALVRKPQHALVILSLTSLLYYGNRKEAIHCARLLFFFKPELLETTLFLWSRDSSPRWRIAYPTLRGCGGARGWKDFSAGYFNTRNCTCFDWCRQFTWYDGKSSGLHLLWFSYQTKIWAATLAMFLDGLLKCNTQGQMSFDIDYDMLQNVM